jgi:hypothetical protein
MNLGGLRRLSRRVPSHTQNEVLALGDTGEYVRLQLAQDFAAASMRADDPGGPKLGDVPADERLAQTDRLDQLPDRRGPFGQALHHAETIDVGEGLVEDAQLPKLVGLIDDRGDRCPDMRGGRQYGVLLGRLQTSLYIKAG